MPKQILEKKPFTFVEIRFEKFHASGKVNVVIKLSVSSELYDVKMIGNHGFPSNFIGVHRCSFNVIDDVYIYNIYICIYKLYLYINKIYIYVFS